MGALNGRGPSFVLHISSKSDITIYKKSCFPQIRNMGLSQTIYNVCFKRTSSMVVTIGVGAFFYERLIDEGVKYFWDTRNQGKLWRDIREKYETPEETRKRKEQQFRQEWWHSDEEGKFWKQ